MSTNYSAEILNKVDHEMSQTIKERSKKKRKSFIILILALILIAIVITFVFLSGLFKGNESTLTILPRKANTEINNGDVKSGKMDIGNAEEIRAGLQENVDSSYITNRINVNPVFESGKSEGNFMIENIEQNKFLVQVEVLLENSEEVIYQSPVLSPGQYIEKANLSKELQKGTYNAIAYFNVFAQDTQEYVNTSGMKITITIKN